MQLSEERIEEFKRIYKEEYNKELSDKEAFEAATNLANFAQLLFECAQRDHRRKLKLEESPNGYHLPEGEIYTCFICHNNISGETSWYSKHGITCMVCKKALDDKVIPTSVMKDRNSWMAMWELKDKLGLHHSTVQKMIRTGELKARIIKNGEHDYFWVFLKEENSNLFNSFVKL